MTDPALDRLGDEIYDTHRQNWPHYEAPDHWDTIIAAMFDVLTRHIPADVLAGLLDGTMVAVPKSDLMFGAGDFARLETCGGLNLALRLADLRDRAMLAAAKQEDRA